MDLIYVPPSSSIHKIYNSGYPVSAPFTAAEAGKHDCLRQLEPGVAGYGVPQLVPQHALLLVVRQLQQIEAGGRGGQPVQRILLADRKEAPYDGPDRVAYVLVVAHLDAPYGKGWLQVCKAQQWRFRTARHKLKIAGGNR